MKTLVLAAGLGTRLRPLTDHVPKPLAPVAGRPVIEHLLDRLEGEVTVNLHHHAGQIRARLGDRVAYSHEPELLGTAGALTQLEAGDWMVLSGDGVHGVDLGALAAHHRASGAVATITVKRLEDPSCCAQVALGPAGLVEHFEEKPEEGFTHLASIGLYCFTPEAIAHVPRDRPSDNARDLVPALLRAGLPVSAYETEARWSDIGTPEELLRANLERAAGETLVLPGCEVAGAVQRSVVGPGAVVGEGAVVRDAVVMPGATVPPGAVVENELFGDPRAVAEAWTRW